MACAARHRRSHASRRRRSHPLPRPWRRASRRRTGSRPSPRSSRRATSPRTPRPSVSAGSTVASWARRGCRLDRHSSPSPLRSRSTHRAAGSPLSLRERRGSSAFNAVVMSCGRQQGRAGVRRRRLILCRSTLATCGSRMPTLRSTESSRFLASERSSEIASSSCHDRVPGTIPSRSCYPFVPSLLDRAAHNSSSIRRAAPCSGNAGR